MRKIFPITLMTTIAGFIAVGQAVPLSAQPGGHMMGDDRGGMRGGMGMGRGMGRGMGPGYRGMIDLSDAQRTKIWRIQDNLRKTHWRIMGKMIDERSRLRKLYAQDKLNAKAIGAPTDASTASSGRSSRPKSMPSIKSKQS